MSRVLELYGHPTETRPAPDWRAIARAEACPFLGRKCIKIRKSDPGVSIGTCTVSYGRDDSPVIICPHRLLERRQVFMDCIPLLSVHEPGNELHVIPEVSLPGGSVDRFLASTSRGHVRDFLGIEFQTLDTTGTVWPVRQKFLQSTGLAVSEPNANAGHTYGMNWKMTAKTTLVQLHHKVATFEHFGKKLVLVVQDCLLAYFRREFDFGHVTGVRDGDPMHFHSYRLEIQADRSYRLALSERISTDSEGIARSLGLQAEARMELRHVIDLIQSRISEATRLVVV